MFRFCFGSVIAVALFFAFAACKPSSSSGSSDSQTVNEPVAEPAQPEASLPPPVIGWTPTLLPDEKVIDVAGFAAVLIRREIPPREDDPLSGHSEYHVLTQAGQRLGPWIRVPAFVAHGKDDYHAYASEKDYGELTPLGAAAADSAAFPPPAGPSCDEPSQEAAGLPGLELRKTEDQETVVWHEKELGAWPAVDGATVSPDGADLYFWAQSKDGGWDVYRNATALTKPDPTRKPLGGVSYGFSPRFVFGSASGQVAYAEMLSNEQRNDLFGTWLVAGSKRWGPFMSFSPEFVWPAGAPAPTFTSRTGMSWTLTTAKKEYTGKKRFKSIDWYVHDSISHEPIWSAAVASSSVDEHDFLVGDTIVLCANVFGKPAFSADGSTLAFTAWYRPRSVFSMNSSTFVILLPRSLKVRPPANHPAPAPSATAGSESEPAGDELENEIRKTMGSLRLFSPPHAGPFGDIKNLRFSASGHAVAFDIENASMEQKRLEPRVFDGATTYIGHLDSDGRTATVFKDGAVVRLTL